MTKFENSRAAMAQRVENLLEVDGTATFPAVPALIDDFTERCAMIFAAAGRRFNDGELRDFKISLARILVEAETFSQRSTVTVAFRSRPAGPLNYTVTMNPVTVEQAYDEWIENREGSLFGLNPDARVMNLAASAPNPSEYRILDVGAGTGRNALALARRGHPVDAVEVTRQFADMMAVAAMKDSLDLRVIERDVLAERAPIRSDYSLIVLSGVVSEFRTSDQLRQLFELVDGHLISGGFLVFNVFVADDDYSPDEAARQFARQSYSGFFTRREIADAVVGVPVELVADDTVIEYERTHLPASAWPPTHWYVNWATGRDVFGTEVSDSPIELRWLVYRRT